jgi:hypothetical protein
LAREKLGRRRLDFLRLHNISNFSTICDNITYSKPDIGRGASKKDGLGGEERISSSWRAGWGVGDCTSICCTKYGILWGKGEISICSSSGTGDEDGSGGVVVFSA